MLNCVEQPSSCQLKSMRHFPETLLLMLLMKLLGEGGLALPTLRPTGASFSSCSSFFGGASTGGKASTPLV